MIEYSYNTESLWLYQYLHLYCFRHYIYHQYQGENRIVELYDMLKLYPNFDVFHWQGIIDFNNHICTKECL